MEYRHYFKAASIATSCMFAPENAPDVENPIKVAIENRESNIIHFSMSVKDALDLADRLQKAAIYRTEKERDRLRQDLAVAKALAK